MLFARDLCWGLLALLATSASAATLPETVSAEPLRGCVTQHDGRWPPLDTVARDFVDKVTGSIAFEGRDPVLLLLGWTFDPQAWEDHPLIEIGNAELRRELELPETQTVFSYKGLLDHEPFMEQLRRLAHTEEGYKLNPLEAKVADIEQILLGLRAVFTGDVIRLIPDPESATAAWRSIPAAAASMEGLTEVSSAWTSLRGAFLADDGPAFAQAAERLLTGLSALPAKYRPTPSLIRTELRYNALQPYRTAWIVMAFGALLAAVAMVVRRKWFDLVAVLGMLAGFAVLTFGMFLRWQIAGRIPAANMFESLLFLSWGMGAFAILAMLVMRDRSVPLTASVMGALALCLADVLPVDSFIRPPPPVLMDTFWMSIHVPIIMLSYSVLAMAMLIAHAQLFVMAVAPRRRNWIAAIDIRHYWYVHVGAILLLTGIITGSMWGASSWGRYWGWDPKEVWSLVAFLGYLTILHVRVDHQRPSPWMYVIG
ncbi:MAG: cytochrome c biogenesis protein CcsA, partial [bacterium]|nr:cytochrome c biogenesis protein CcsA [bacterium]